MKLKELVEEAIASSQYVNGNGMAVVRVETLRHAIEHAVVGAFCEGQNDTSVLAAGIADTRRLDWLIEHGYTPAKWRSPRFLGEPVRENGFVFDGQGGRAEIDEAMARGVLVFSVAPTATKPKPASRRWCKDGCPHPILWSEPVYSAGCGFWFRQLSPHATQAVDADLKWCGYCGEPRPD